MGEEEEVGVGDWGRWGFLEDVVGEDLEVLDSEDEGHNSQRPRTLQYQPNIQIPLNLSIKLPKTSQINPTPKPRPNPSQFPKNPKQHIKPPINSQYNPSDSLLCFEVGLQLVLAAVVVGVVVGGQHEDA